MVDSMQATVSSLNFVAAKAILQKIPSFAIKVADGTWNIVGTDKIIYGWIDDEDIDNLRRIDEAVEVDGDDEFTEYPPKPYKMEDDFHDINIWYKGNQTVLVCAKQDYYVTKDMNAFAQQKINLLNSGYHPLLIHGTEREAMGMLLLKMTEKTDPGFHPFAYNFTIRWNSSYSAKSTCVTFYDFVSKATEFIAKYHLVPVLDSDSGNIKFAIIRARSIEQGVVCASLTETMHFIENLLQNEPQNAKTSSKRAAKKTECEEYDEDEDD